jgi:hypothetical protein
VAATASVTLSAANSAALAAAAAVAVVVAAAAVVWSYVIMPAHLAVLFRTASLLAHHKHTDPGLSAGRFLRLPAPYQLITRHRWSLTLSHRLLPASAGVQ